MAADEVLGKVAHANLNVIGPCRMDYAAGVRMQRDLLQRCIASGGREGFLMLLEHPPVVTVGRSGAAEEVLAARETLRERGVALVETNRGGRVTFHGPGQLVGYPIIDLKCRERDLHRYVSELEEMLIDTLADFGIRAARDSSHRGVWVAEEEIVAIGLRVKKWVTMHGFALNVNTDLAPFSLINPCGFSDRGATSMAALLSREVPLRTVTEKLLARFSQVFEAQLELASAQATEAMLAEAGGYHLARA